MTDIANGAHAAAMGYIEEERRGMRERRAAREARRGLAVQQATQAEMVTPDLEKTPEDQHAEMGMFTRPRTQSVNQAANRQGVTDNSFKRDLTPQANSAEADRSRDYSRDNDNGGVAYNHMNLQQSNARALVNDVLCRLRTNSQAYVGQSGFESVWGETDRPHGAPGNSVELTDFDAAQMAGEYEGMGVVDNRPGIRTEYASAQQSATKPNGSHSTSGSVTSYAAPKASRLDIMKAAMRGEL